MQVAVEKIEDVRAKRADAPFRLARLGARPLPPHLLPPPIKIEIIDSEPEGMEIDVISCRNDVVFVSRKCAEAGLLAFVNPKDRRLKIAHIQRVVCSHFQVTLPDMLSHRRPVHVSHARQVAMYLASTMELGSLPAIGRSFDRDHTSVMHSVRKIKALVTRDVGLADEIKGIKAKLTGEVKQ